MILIKNTCIIYSCIYFFIKLLNIKPNHKQKFYVLYILIISTILTTVSEHFSAIYSNILLVPLLLLHFLLLFKHTFLQSFIATIIAYSFSYLCFLISSICICIPFVILNISYRSMEIQIMIFILQLIIIRMPFCFKRTKKLVLLLTKYQYYIPCTIVGIIILIVSCLINLGKEILRQPDSYITILIFSLLVCGIYLTMYIRTSITKTYLDQLTKRNNIDLNNQLEQITRKYDELYADKERLSAIVHSDKKLVNALKNAVMNYLENGNNDNERGKELLEEIERYSKEREGNIQETEKFLNPLPSCNIVVIDNLLAYMYQKAQQNNIELSLMINCDVVAASKDLINLEDFSTLLADLIDNAIIATIHNKGKLILVSFSIVKKHFTIQISDSGIPFTTEVLYTMGKERITTHADDNGNGIGLMQTFETLHKTNASLFIEEYNNPQAIYTKSLSVVFNKKNQTVLYTTRDQMEIAQLYQKSNLIIMKK